MYIKTLPIFEAQMDYIFFIYGLAFILLGIVAFILHFRKSSPIPWIWLCTFGILHGINEWIDLSKLAFAGEPMLEYSGHFVAALSFFALWTFGGRHLLSNKAFLALTALLVAISSFMLWSHPSEIGQILRYFWAFPAAMFSAYLLWSHSLREKCKYLKFASLLVGIYAVGAGIIVPKGTLLLSPHLNYETFLEQFGFPVQLLRMGLALGIAFSIWSYYLIHQNHDNDTATPIHPPLARRLLLMLLSIIVGGYYFTNLLGERKEELMLKEFITRVTIAANVIDRHEVASLNGNDTDIGTLSYEHLKSWLADVNVASRFAYLMTIRDGKVYFLADSEHPHSPDCSPPGQLYEETTPPFYYALIRNKPFIIGPESDRWGTYITAVTPLGSLLSQGEPVYLLFDIDYGEWKDDVAISRQFAILIILLFIILITYFTAASNKIFHTLFSLNAERKLFIGGPVVVIKWKILPHRWQVTYVSANLQSHLNLFPERMMDEHYSLLNQIHPDDLPQLTVGLNGLTIDVSELEQELRLRHEDGSYRWFHLFVIRQFDRYNEWFQGYFTEISSRKEAEASAVYLATHDILTGYPRTAILSEFFNKASLRAKRNNGKVAVMYLDIDRFSRINEAFGHAFGNDLILEFGKRLKEYLPDTVSIGREGGDEFLLLVPISEENESIPIIAEKIHREILYPFTIDEEKITLSCSIGIAVFPDDGESFETLMQQADAALAEAKNSGRATYVFASKSTNEKIAERLTIENQLRFALENKELSLHYQPKIDVESQKIMGAEALLRWNNPILGSVSPAVFIPIAEENGLIVAIGEWVLEEACAQNRRWQEIGYDPIIVAVNMSSLQLKRPDFIATVKNILERSSLAPEYLELELTESILADEHNTIVSTLQELRAMGISISIDDFGTGYSNFLYLKQFNVTNLKIDQSFIAEIGAKSDIRSIVDTMIKFAAALNLGTIAEGVETQEQLSILSHLGCDEIQGYYFSKPLPSDDFERYLKETLISSPSL